MIIYTYYRIKCLYGPIWPQPWSLPKDQGLFKDQYPAIAPLLISTTALQQLLLAYLPNHPVFVGTLWSFLIQFATCGRDHLDLPVMILFLLASVLFCFVLMLMAIFTFNSNDCHRKLSRWWRMASSSCCDNRALKASTSAISPTIIAICCFIWSLAAPYSVIANLNRFISSFWLSVNSCRRLISTCNCYIYH